MRWLRVNLLPSFSYFPRENVTPVSICLLVGAQWQTFTEFCMPIGKWFRWSKSCPGFSPKWHWPWIVLCYLAFWVAFNIRGPCCCMWSPFLREWSSFIDATLPKNVCIPLRNMHHFELRLNVFMSREVDFKRYGEEPENLTAHISRTQKYPHSNGGFGNIWKCILKNSFLRNGTKVRWLIGLLSKNQLNPNRYPRKTLQWSLS